MANDALTKTFQRDVTGRPHPMYGIDKGGFSIGDLSNSYQEGALVFDTISAPATSAPIALGANAIELVPQFSDTTTSCDITVYLADGVTAYAVFPQLSILNSRNVFAGFYEQRSFIGGGALIFKASNWFGTGTLTLRVRRTG